MIGAFPRRGAWVTLQLAAVSDDGQATLLELTGDCPADPAAHTTRATTCASAEDALAHAAARILHGWAEDAAGERPAGRRAAAAVLHAPAWTPRPGEHDRRLTPGAARAVVAHAAAAAPEPFCLFPNPTGRRGSRGPTKETTP